MPNRKNDPLYQAALAASSGKATGSAVQGTNSGGYTSTVKSSVSKKGKAYPTSYALAQAAKRSAERMKNTDYELYGSARITPASLRSRNTAAAGQNRDEFDSRVRSNYAKKNPDKTGGLYAAAQRSANSLNILSDHLKAAEATVTIAQNNYQRNANVNTAAQFQTAKNNYDVALKATQNQLQSYRETMAAVKQYETTGAGRDTRDARIRSNYAQKQAQKIMNSGTEYGNDLKLRNNLQKASAQYETSKSRLASAQRNAPMDTNRGERRVTNTAEIQSARTQLGQDRKSLQAAQKKANDYIQKQVDAAAKKYNGKFDEKAARQLANVSNPTLAQQAEMRALVDAYDKTEAKKRGDVHSIAPLRQALEAKSGTLSARVSQTVEGGLRDSASGYLNAGRAALDWANEAHGGEMNKTAQTVRNWLSTNADRLDQQSQQNIQNAKANLGTIGQTAVDIGSQMTQMYADSLAGAGRGALGSMAVRVFGGSYQDAREQGASANRAIAYAGLQALKEYATEKMFGLAVPIYGRGSMMGVEEMIADGIERAASQASSRFGQQAVHSFLTMLGAFGTEGLEEFVSAIGDPLVSSITVGNKDDLKQYGNSDYWSDVGYQFLVGGIMGMLGSGVSQVTGQSTVDPVRMQELQESRENLTNIRNTNARLFNNGSVTAEGQQVLGNNFAANQRQQNPTVGFANYGSSDIDYQARMGRAIPTNLQQAAINATNAQPAQPVGSQATAMHVDTESVTNPVTPFEAPAVTAAAAPTVTNTAANTVPVSQQVAPTVRAETPANINENIDTINNDVDEQVHNPTVTTPAPAPTYTPSAIRQATYQSEMPTTDREATERKMTYAPMISIINRGKGLGVNGKRAFTQSINYDVSPDTYYQGFIDYYNAGQSGVKFKSVKSEFGAKLSPEQRYAAWASGQNDAAVQTSAKRAVMKDVPISLNPGLEKNEYARNLDNGTRDFIDRLGKDLGQRIVLVESLNGGKENGMNRHNGDILIAVDSEDKHETIKNKVVSVVARHEISHQLETLAPDEYEQLRNHITRNWTKLSQEVYGTSSDLNTLILNKVTLYNKYAQKYNIPEAAISNDGAIREIVADFIGHMDEDSIRSIVNSNRSLAGKIIDILRDVVANIKKAFGGDGGSMAETLRLFEKTYRAASEQAKKNSGNTGENAQIETSESSQFSIKYDVNGEPYVLIENDILEGVPVERWVREVNSYMQEHFKDGVQVGNSLIKISKKSRGHLLRSEYADVLRSHNLTKYKDRLIAIANADEFLKASRDYINEEPTHERTDNIEAFARGRVQFRTGNNDYVADAVVGITRENELLFYAVDHVDETTIKVKADTDNTVRTKMVKDSSPSVSANDTVSSSDSAVNQEPQRSIKEETYDVRESMTMARAKNMLDRAFNAYNIEEYYDGEYKNVDEWIAGEGVADVALHVESEYDIYNTFLSNLPGIQDESYTLEDIIEAYANKELVGAQKKPRKAIDIAKNVKVSDSKFYSPKEIRNAKELLETANLRANDSNREAVTSARAKLLLYAHNKGAAETLGMTEAELNKKLRSWGGYSATARKVSMRINEGASVANRWTGIENSAWLSRYRVSNDDIKRMVKSVQGRGNEYETRYIGNVMLALDTHIDWSWINFKFVSMDEVNADRSAGANDLVKRCAGFYDDKQRLIEVGSGAQHTVAHEMGHALDAQWGRDLGLSEFLSRSGRSYTPGKLSGDAAVFYDHFVEFMDDISQSASIKNSYYQDPSETLARFVDAFVAWTEKIATGHTSDRIFSSAYDDKFTQAQFVKFAKLLQEKAAIDNAGLTNNKTDGSKREDVPHGQFSLKEPVEISQKLIAIHNLPVKGLMQNLKLGGFASPSIAVTKPDMAHNNFGDVSVVFRREAIDPKANRANRLYGSDAWTPTSPTRARSVNTDKLDEVINRLNESANKIGDGVFAGSAGSAFYDFENDYTTKNVDDITNNLFWNDGVFSAYAAENDIDIPTVYEPSGEVDYMRTRENLGKVRMSIAREENVKVDFREWINSILDGVFGEYGIPNGKDMFTPSGNRRTFKQLYDPVTLEGIVKAMYRGGKERGLAVNAGNVRGVQAVASESFSSVEEARAQADRLQDDYETFKESEHNAQTKLDVLRIKTKDKLGIDEYDYIMDDVLDEAIVNAATGKRTIDAIVRAFQKEDLSIDNGLAKEWQEMFDRASAIPVKYFEAKPKRVVGLDEVVGIAVPEDTDQLSEIEKICKDNGIEVSTYKWTENASDRVRAVNEFAASFSFKEDLRNMRNDNDAYKEYLEAQVEKVTKQNQNLRSEMKRNTNNARDPKELSRFVRKLLKDVSSPLDSTEVADRLNQLFMDIDRGYVEVEDFDDYMLPGLDNYDYADQETGEVKMKRIDLRNSLNMYKEFEKVATWLIESAEAKDHEVIEQAKEIRSYLRRNPIIYDESIMNDVSPDFSAWRKAQKFRMHKAKYGERMNVDQVYMEMMEEFPGWFDETIINPADQLLRISEVMDILDRASVNNPWSEAYDVAIDGLTQDLISGYVEVPVKITYADRQAALRKAQHSRDVARANARVEKERAKSRERIENERAKNRERINNIIQRNAQSKAKALEEQRIKFLNREEKAAERREMREIRNKIYKHAQKLSTKLLKPTDTQHVPEELKAAVAEALRNINIESRTTWDPYTHSVRWDGRGEPTARTKAWQAASLEYQKIITAMKEGGELETPLLIDPDIDYYFQQVIQFSEIPVHSMTKQQLETTWSLITAIEHSIASANKALAFEKYARISDLAEDIYDSSVYRKTKKGKHKRGSVAIDLENPYTFFGHFGDAGMKIYRTLRNAQDTVEKNTKLVHDMVRQIVTKEEIKRLSTERAEFDIDIGEKNGETVTEHIVLTKEHIMDIYLYSKRAQAMNHMMNGGIIQPEIKAHPTKKLPKIERGTKKIPLDESSLSEIIGTLTDEEKQIADGLQEIASGFLAGLGNTVSLQAYGYKKFGDPNYWAIATAPEDTFQAMENSKENARSIKNIGMAKSLVPNSTNAISIRGAFNTFAQSAADMIEYNAWLLPMEDCNRLFNYKYKNSDTFKTVIEKAAGKGAQKYWMELMKDIQNGIKPSDDTASEKDIRKFIGRAKGAAVGANIRVVIQQPTAYMRAFAVLSPDAFLKGITVGMVRGATPGKAYEKAIKYAPIAAIKARGSFDQGSSRTIYQDLFGINSVMDTIGDMSGYFASKADELTWGRLWNACEWQCKSKHPDLPVGSEEFYEETGRIFSDMIDQSQVVDGILQRSQIMRSQGLLAQTATAFMGEPIMTLNMLMRAYDKWRYESRPYQRTQALKGVGVAVTAVGLNAVVNAFAQSFVDAMRDYDDDDYWKKYWRAMLDWKAIKEAATEDKILPAKILDTLAQIHDSNVLDNLDLIGNIPYIKDIISYLRGYTVQRMDAQLFGDLVTAFQNMATEDYWKSDTQATIDVLNQVAKIFGIPISNLYRDAFWALRTFAYETDNLGMLYALDKWYYNEGTTGNKTFWVRKKFQDYLTAAEEQGNEDLADVIRSDIYRAGMSKKEIAATDKALAPARATKAYKDLSAENQQFVNTMVKAYTLPDKYGKDLSDAQKWMIESAKEAEKQGVSAAEYLTYYEVRYAAKKANGDKITYEETASALRKAGLSGSKLDTVFAIMYPKATKAGSEY